MTHVDYRIGFLALAPLVLVFLAGITAGVVAIFLVCNVPLMKRLYDHGRGITFAVTAAASLSVLVFLGSVLSGLVLVNGVFGQTAFVPDDFPTFLLPYMLEFFLVMLVPLVLAFVTFGALRYGSELSQRVVVPAVFLAAFVVCLSLTKAWASYEVISAELDIGAFITTTAQITVAEFTGLWSSFEALGRFASTVQAGRGGGLFAGFFDTLGSRADLVWGLVKNAGGNQFVMSEAFPEIFAVSSVAALLYMVLRWPFTAFSRHEDD